MAIIPIPPTVRFSELVFDTDFRSQRNRSGWTGTSKTVGLPGAERWYITGTLRMQATEANVRTWRAFKMALRGQLNSFRLPVCKNQGGGVTTITALDSSHRAMTLNEAEAVQVGMFGTITLPSGYERLFVVTGKEGDVITFEPTLPETPALDAPVDLENPWCLVAQVEPRTGWTDSNGIGSFSFETEEAR